jgi:hypothetical protein
MYVTAPIVVDGDKVGEISIVGDLSRINEETQKIIYSALLAVVIVLVG